MNIVEEYVYNNASHKDVVFECKETGRKLFWCAKCKRIHENVSVDLGMLTPEYLTQITNMYDEGLINKATGDKMIKWYMTCDEKIRGHK